MRAAVAGSMPGTVVETSYRELAAPHSLAGLVACAWVGEPGRARQLRVIPDGAVDVAWDGDRVTVTRSVARPLRLPVGTTSVVGIRLRPGVAGQLLGSDISTLAPVTDLADLWGARAVGRLLTEVARPPRATRAVALAHAVAGAATDADRDHVVVSAADAIEAGATRVDELARHLNISERQLRRRFATATGLSLAAYRRIVRLHRFLRQADRGIGVGLSDLAAGAGYSDQAHLSRDCRSLTGSSPAELLGLRAGR